MKRIAGNEMCSESRGSVADGSFSFLTSLGMQGEDWAMLTTSARAYRTSRTKCMSMGINPFLVRNVARIRTPLV